MKIIFVEAVQSYGGAQIATVDLAYRLSQMGHAVSIIDCHGCCEVFVEAVKNAKLSFDILLPRSEPYVIGKYSSKLRNFFRLVGYFRYWLKMRSRLKQLLNKSRPDAVVCYNDKVLSMIPKSDGYQIVYYAHGWYLPSQISFVMRKLLKNRPSKILAVSQATRMALYAGGIASLDKVSVVHNAIDVSELPSSVATIEKGEGKFKVLMCGGFLSDKGQHIAVEVARELKNEGFPICLVLTGIIYQGHESKMYYDRIIEMIDRYDLSDCVEIVCGKPNVIDYFRACDCLIHPSSSEGFGLVVLEAMALDKPVIVNAVGGVIDMVLDGFTGIITPHNDVAAYVAAIKKLASDNQFRENIVGNAKSLTEASFTKERQIEQFLSAIK